MTAYEERHREQRETFLEVQRKYREKTILCFWEFKTNSFFLADLLQEVKEDDL
jgi:hypothetical protein